jgi:hypothetical protein
MKGYGQKRYLQRMIGLIEKNDPSTCEVVLNGFDIPDSNLAELAMALSNNSHVVTLYLDGSGISDRGVGLLLLAYALQTNSTLKFLSLNDNNIQSAGADALAAALHENKTLITLRLENNAIGNRGGKRLKTMLRNNNAIEEIFLDGNNISPKIIVRFDDRCKNVHGLDFAHDITASSTSGSEFTPHTHTSSEADETNDGDDELEEKLTNADLEWASSSAWSFGATLYMNNDEARKYIIGCEDAEDHDANSSWTNLASYMMDVQNTMDPRERAEDDDGDDACCHTNDDLTVALFSDQVPAISEKPRKRWTLFKKSKTANKIHAKDGDEPSCA